MRTSHTHVSLYQKPVSMMIRDILIDKGPPSCTYPSENWIILPFFDHASQFRPGSTLSLRFKIRIGFGDSAVGGFETLHTRRSPSEVCVASMSDFCLVDDACHARLTMGEGARGVVKVCKMVKVGCSATIKMEPFKYLIYTSATSLTGHCNYQPDCICMTVCGRR